jgi:hypothetical protein
MQASLLLQLSRFRQTAKPGRIVQRHEPGFPHGGSLQQLSLATWTRVVAGLDSAHDKTRKLAAPPNLMLSLQAQGFFAICYNDDDIRLIAEAEYLGSGRG